MTPRETDPDLSGSVQESPAEVWVGGSLLVGALSVAAHVWDLLKEVTIIFITSTLASGQQQEGNTAPPINRKLD